MSIVPTTPALSVAAILRSDEGHYLLQHRENKPEIDYPNWWCLFGGRAEPDESPRHAIERELTEEISFAPGDLQFFTTLTWDLCHYRMGVHMRQIFQARLSAELANSIRLSEGQGWRYFTLDEIEAGVPVIPNDLFVLHLFERRFEHPSVRGISAAS